MRFRRKKKKSSEKDIKESLTPLQRETKERNKPGYQLVDFSTVRDFFNWGMNRSLTDLRVRRMVDVKTREERMKRGESKDLVKVMMTLVVIVIAGGIAFMMITQFLNYDEATRGLAQCIIDGARKQAEFELCQARTVTQAGTLLG